MDKTLEVYSGNWPITVLQFATVWQGYAPAFKLNHLSLHFELYRGTSESARFNFVIVKIKVSLKSDKNNGHCIWRPLDIFDHISFRSS